MLRVTTNSTIYSYRKNLLKSTNQLYSAMNSMMSGRNFDTYAADPAAATRAFQIHSSLNATNTQYANSSDPWLEQAQLEHLEHPGRCDPLRCGGHGAKPQRPV